MAVPEHQGPGCGLHLVARKAMNCSITKCSREEKNLQREITTKLFLCILSAVFVDELNLSV